MKFKNLFACGLIATMFYNSALPSLHVHANELSSNEAIIYQELGVKINILTDDSEKRIVEEIETSTGEITIYTFNKLDNSLTIETNSGATVFSEQDLISVANNEFYTGTFFRASGYAGFWSIGYEDGHGSYFAKITSKGRVYTKRKNRRQVNIGYYNAFKSKVDTIRSLEHQFALKAGTAALGAILTGGVGALTALGLSASAVQTGQAILNNTSQAQAYYWKI